MQDTVPRRFLPLVLIAVVTTAFLSVAATTVFVWPKDNVVAVVLVKPNVIGFVPVDGGGPLDRWNKDQVIPVTIVDAGPAGFKPHGTLDIVNIWKKEEVTAVVLTEPTGVGFKPLELSGEAKPTAVASEDGKETIASALERNETAGVIRSQVKGAFSGWQGETIVQLSNGQIWQQAEFHYEYHYVYAPDVLIYRTGFGYKMKVDGTEATIAVRRLD